MLTGKIVLHEAFKKDFNKIKSYCDLHDIQIYRLDQTLCAVLAKPKRMYKLMKFVRKYDRKVVKIELFD